MPLVLGSLYFFIIMLVYIPIIAKRIRNEEKVLEESLPQGQCQARILHLWPRGPTGPAKVEKWLKSIAKE